MNTIVETKLTKDIVKQLDNDSNMLSYLKDNFDQISAMSIAEQLEVMARLQWVRDQLNTLELRLREEIIPHYDCENGKTKTKTDKELGFKIETKRPVNSKFFPKTTDAQFRKVLGMKNAQLNEVFPATRPFSASGFNKLEEEQQKALAELMEVKLGQIAVKVTPL